MKSRRMRWAGHVARMGEKRNAYRILVGKPEGKRPIFPFNNVHIKLISINFFILNIGFIMLFQYLVTSRPPYICGLYIVL
jgi:hypothetical protein